GGVTSPHQTAATMVTGVDEVAPPPSDIPSQASTMPTVLAPAKAPAQPTIMSASQAAAYPPSAQPAAPVPAPPKRSSSAFLIAGAGLLVLLIIAGVGGYFVMHNMVGSPANTATSNNPGNTSASETEVAAGHEVGRYWLQVNTAADSVRAGEQVTMDSGQQFKLHFSPSESGYVY